ncbi:MAG: hypothetical protein HYY16_16440 [Planctomycetes bacterium]|nr:hypothetical protein [Planctomycetota bacterium]
MAEWDRLRDEVLAILRDEVRDLWEVEDVEFLRALATDVAREKVLAATAPHPQVHERNLLHLAATLEGEIERKKLRLDRASRQAFARVVGAVIKTVALPGLSATPPQGPK